MGIPSIATGALLLYAASELNWISAAEAAMDGAPKAFGRAADYIVAGIKVENILPIIVGGVGIAIARQAVGPVVLCKIGRFNIRAL